MTLWFTARGAGLSALVLLSAATGLGALVAGRGRATTRVVGQYLHRVTAALGLGVLVLHIATILADSYAHVGVIGAIVPFTSGYRATWVGLGTIAAYLLLMVAALGAARGRMAATARGAAIWRGLHGSAYLAWAVAVVHGYESGTDSAVGWVQLIYLGCLATVTGCVVARVAGRVRPDLVRSGPLRSGLLRSGLMHSDPMRSDPMRSARFGGRTPALPVVTSNPARVVSR